jgi:D-arabinose 1-dehydrogenase-like Zn-dependent alcohol dehydrogenase
MGHAAFLVRPQLTLVREIKLPRPEDNQVLVRLEGCGICDSNLSVWEGRPWFVYPREPGAPGHEGWGIVEAVGAAVTDIDVGQRVAMLSGHAYAEFDIAPRDRVIPLPDELDDEPFPADSFGRAMSIFQRGGIRSGHSVAIVGDGLVELLLAQLAADAGAHVVMLSDRADALQLAESMDAEQTLEIARRTGSAAGDGAERWARIRLRD